MPVGTCSSFGRGRALLDEEGLEDGKCSFFLVELLPRWERFGDGELLGLDEEVSMSGSEIFSWSQSKASAEVVGERRNRCLSGFLLVGRFNRFPSR